MPQLGSLLRVDLAQGRVRSQAISKRLRRQFLGGEGINDWLLWEHFLKVSPRIDPVSPDNPLILGVGPLGATGLGAGCKMKWTFKGPAYGIFGDSVSGGNFGSHLRWAGFDHVVLTGKAPQPVYLWIDDDKVELRDARHLWGKDAHEADRLIKQELGDKEIETAVIGRAGENLVRFASIMVSRYRAAGRAGGGCVMGSKNLKAIAVRGTKGIQPADPKGFMEMIADLHERLNRNVRARDGYRLFGTLLATGFYQRIGVNAYRNNQHSLLPEEKYQKLSHRAYNTKMEDGALSCSAGCVSPCGGWHRVKGDESPAAHDHAGSLGSKPEYLGIASFGVICDIPDMAAVTHLSERCNDYGMDLVEMGGICGFLLELWQRGLISPQDAQEWFGGPVALEWGDYKAVEKIIDVIALHKGKLGDLFQAGLYKGAQRLEEEKNISALQYALYGKGGAVFTEDIRHTPSWALNMAVASRGSDHLKGHGTLDKMNRADISQHYFGTPDGAKPFDITLKGAGSAKAEVRCGIINSLGFCIHLVSDDPLLYPHELFCRALETAIGLKLTPDELEAVGKRVVNLEKAFNSRLGLRREDDKLCHRWMNERMEEGPGKGWSCGDYLEKLKDEYYQTHGWDQKTSLPTRQGLDALGLGDVAGVLEREEALG